MHNSTVRVQKGFREEICSWAKVKAKGRRIFRNKKAPDWGCRRQSGVSGIQGVLHGSHIFSDNLETDGSLSRPSG